MLSIGFTGDVSFSGFFEEKIRKEEHIFSREHCQMVRCK